MTCARAVARALLLLTAAIPGARGQLPEAGSTMAQSALDRLAHRGRALLIAAHPDDENTALLAWLARGRHVDTAYLSLTRGEGGQNLIGPEQGSLLGLIRTEELLAARRMDGAAQMFTRAVDFGYSKRPEEAFTKWGREQVLGDVVLAIRRFRPDVIILRFSGTPRDGHGHHQASAILGREAFEAAADASRFPEQLTSVKPWRARRLVSNALSFTPEQEKEASALPGRVELDLGAYSPMLGYSWSEIAAISRSQHRSQGMGTPRHRGAQKNYFVHLAGEPFERDLFEGVELTSRVGEFRRAAQEFDHRDPARVVPLLLAGRPRAEDKVAVDEAIALCTGLHLRATADRPYAAWGSSVRIGVEAVNRSTVPLMLEEVKAGPAGALKPAAELRDNVPLAYQLQWRSSEPVHISSDHLAALPDPALKVRFLIRAQDQVLELERPVVHLYVDKIQGELSRPFLPGPPVSVRVSEPVAVFPSASSRTLAVQVRSFGANRTGTLRIQAPAGWTVQPAHRDFSLALDGEEAALSFNVAPPSSAASGVLKAVATVEGQQIATNVLTIDYPHIPARTAFLPSEARLVRADVQVLARRVGYVMGAGDEVPEALRQMGCAVTLLEEADLTRGDLSGFGAIVTGVRAFNTRADLRASHARLMEYVRAGGTMVVQYNVLEGGFMGGDPTQLDRIGPLPLKIGRERVSVEDAPVELLQPDHDLLRRPNRITGNDWEGWVQERGLYFPAQWDPGYTALVSMSDPQEKPVRGGILYARHGKGVYVFTSLSWFRQLPAGVPGAWRIFANLISAGKAQ